VGYSCLFPLNARMLSVLDIKLIELVLIGNFLVFRKV